MMAKLPPDPYAPDQMIESDGTPRLDDQPRSLACLDNAEAPAIEPGHLDDAPRDTPVQTEKYQ
jgi:hypothetical protein